MTLLIALLTGAAFGAVTDEDIHARVSEAYGKAVPPQAVCIVRDLALPDEFEGDPIAVGVMRGAKGCNLFGLMVKGGWVSPERAAPASLDSEAWARANSKKKAELMQAWTMSVMLAFDQLDITDPKPVARTTGSGGVEVEASFWQRADKKHHASHLRGTFYYANDGALENADREGGELWSSSFTVREYRATGVSVEAVMAALKQQGRTLAKCMDAAWQEDVTIEGRTRFQWTIREGKATQIALVAEDDTGGDLAACYNRALQKIQFPAEMGGQVIWSFNVVRQKVN